MICRFIASRLILMSIFNVNITQCGEICPYCIYLNLYILAVNRFQKILLPQIPFHQPGLVVKFAHVEVNTYKGYKFK